MAVSNHSRIPDFDIRVRKNLVLVGANGAGKSSILRCMNMLFGMNGQQLNYTIGPDDFADSESTLSVKAKLTDLTDDELSLFPDEVDAQDGNSLVIELDANIEDDGVSIRRYCPNGIPGKTLSFAQRKQVGWIEVSADSSVRTFRSGRSNVVDELLKTVDIDADKKSLSDAIDELCGAIDGSSALDLIREGLAGSLNSAIDGGVTKSDLRFIPGAVTDDNFLSDVRLQIRDNGGDMREVANQSDGMKALISLVIYYLIEADASILAIDEPEIHLHPSSQRNLIELMQQSGKQLIIATHSPVVVSKFSPDNVVAIQKDGDITQPTQGFLEDDEKVLARWWISRQLEPLTAKWIIAVEGQSDRMVLEAVARALNKHLDRDGIEILEAGGSGDMPTVALLFGDRGFKIPLTILVDQDAEDGMAKAYKVDKSRLHERGVFVSRSDLEEEYVRAIGAGKLWDAIMQSPLFTDNMRATLNPSSSNGIPTDEELSHFCRTNRYKIKSAVVACKLLDSDNAARVQSIASVIKDVQL